MVPPNVDMLICFQAVWGGEMHLGIFKWLSFLPRGVNIGRICCCLCLYILQRFSRESGARVRGRDGVCAQRVSLLFCVLIARVVIALNVRVAAKVRGWEVDLWPVTSLTSVVEVSCMRVLLPSREIG